jgi:hypothetical protein
MTSISNINNLGSSFSNASYGNNKSNNNGNQLQSAENTLTDVRSGLTEQAQNLGSSFSNASYGNNKSNNNNGNQLQSAENTLTDVRSGLTEQAQKLNELQTTLQSVSKDVNNQSGGLQDQLEGREVSVQGSSTYSLYGKRENVSNLEGIDSPEILEKARNEIGSQFINKVYELKEKFIQYKLDEENSAYKRLYERCGHELDFIRNKGIDLDKKIIKMNNILNLRLSNVDNEINKNLHIGNTLRSRIEQESDEDYSFAQFKEDEVQQYRLNMFYILGLFLGMGILVKKISEFTPKK